MISELGVEEIALVVGKTPRIEATSWEQTERSKDWQYVILFQVVASSGGIATCHLFF